MAYSARLQGEMLTLENFNPSGWAAVSDNVLAPARWHNFTFDSGWSACQTTALAPLLKIDITADATPVPQ
jgi:hypothetical protein